MTTLTYRQAMLIKHTAWVNMQERKPTQADEKYVSIAVKMLLYVACLNYAMLDLEQDLGASGRLKHEVRRRFSQSQNLVFKVHGTAYGMLLNLDPRAAYQYNDRMESAYQRISDCILLAGPEKSYNVVLSLCRLIEKYNGRISGRYDFAPAKALYRIPSLLECAGIEDCKIDEIIELNLTD